MNTRPRPTPPSRPHMMQGWAALSLLFAGEQFRDLEEYLDLVGRFVREEQQRFRDRVDAQVAAYALAGGDPDEVHSFHEDAVEQLHGTFPRVAHASTLVMACALLEGSLADLCKDFERDTQLPTPTRWADVNDRGIRKAAGFLKRNFGIELARDPRWADLHRYFAVRHCIAHAHGDVSLMDRKAQTELPIIAQQFAADGLRISSTDRLEVDASFVARVIGDFTAFWAELVRACRDNDAVGPRLWP